MVLTCSRKRPLHDDRYGCVNFRSSWGAVATGNNTDRYIYVYIYRPYLIENIQTYTESDLSLRLSTNQSLASHISTHYEIKQKVSEEEKQSHVLSRVRVISMYMYIYI